VNESHAALGEHSAFMEPSPFGIQSKKLTMWLCVTETRETPNVVTEKYGGDDGTRTRDLCRDRAAF
jgi:hypothetical protein